jgi:tetratricopeptide (TPR) repeat protein
MGFTLSLCHRVTLSLSFMRRYSLEIGLGLVLAVMTAAVYSRLLTYGFINYDDTQYGEENHRVRGGLTQDNVVWAFRTNYAANWHPLTWLSLQADATFYPASFLARGCHLTNLVWHILNTLLLFAVLRRITGAVWRCALVAALFAVHPLHVESVAWVSERKDVLSTFFWMLTLWAYAAYAERPGWLRYVLVVLAFALGLLAKPMLVTLPFVLLLLDYWPLARMKSEIRPPNSEPYAVGFRFSDFGFRVLEKLPLFALSAASSITTCVAQQEGGAVQTLERFSLSVRLSNAMAAYVGYLRKMIWPDDLALFYPHLGASLLWWQVVGAGALLLAVTSLALAMARRRPYLAVGWLWYLGTLVPVIGLVQVGAQALADRYTYVPLIGIFIMFAWGLGDLAVRWPAYRGAFAMMPVLLVALCWGRTWIQTEYWRNSVSIWSHALEVTDRNYLAHIQLGIALLPDRNDETAADRRKRYEAAARQLQKGLKIKPNHPRAHVNLTVVLEKLGRSDEAMKHAAEALRLMPESYTANFNMGLLLEKQGKLDDAANCYRKALEIFEGHVDAHNRLGRLLIKQSRPAEAVDSFRRAVELRPEQAEYQYNLAGALQEAGRPDEAALAFATARQLAPDWPDQARQEAWRLATTRSPAGQTTLDCVRLARLANQATGCHRPEFLDTLAAAYAAASDFDRAVACASEAEALAVANPELARAIKARLQLYRERQPFRAE